MNSAMMGNITANDIDCYIHFSARKNLDALHEELLATVSQKIQQENANIESRFKVYDSVNNGQV